VWAVSRKENDLLMFALHLMTITNLFFLRYTYMYINSVHFYFGFVRYVREYFPVIICQ